MVSTILKKCFVIIVILTCCGASPEKESDSHIRELYNELQKAVNDTHYNTNIHSISRRVFVEESEYQIHVNKLKEVNGFKMHNIVIKHPETNSTIYFNNPLESKLPHPFMSLDEFKNAIIEQRVKDRDKFEKSKLENQNLLMLAKRKSTTKFKFTPRKKFLRARDVVTTAKKITTKPADIKLNTQTSKIKPIEKRTTPKNIASRSIDVQEKSSFRTVSSSIAFMNSNKMSDANKNSKKLKLNVKERTVSKSLVSAITAETKVPVNSLVAVKVIANTTYVPTPKLKNYTVSSEKNEDVNNTISNMTQKATLPTLDKVLPLPVDEDIVNLSKTETKTDTSTDEGKFEGQGKKQSINTDDEEETVILKETAIDDATNIKAPQQENHTVSLEKSENVNDTRTVDENKEGSSNKERASFELGQLLVDGKQSVNNVYDEEINVFDETTTEPRTTTTPTTTRVKWSRPKVFMGGQESNEGSKD